MRPDTIFCIQIPPETKTNPQRGCERPFAAAPHAECPGAGGAPWGALLKERFSLKTSADFATHPPELGNRVPMATAEPGTRYHRMLRGLGMLQGEENPAILDLGNFQNIFFLLLNIFYEILICK